MMWEGLSASDLVAPIFMFTVWMGYSWYADSYRWEDSLTGQMYRIRRRWMQQMVKRELRMPDVQSVAMLANSVLFFASTAILIIAGVLAMLGTRETIISLLNDLPFLPPTSMLLLDLKLATLLGIFVYAFFKLSWSVRQYNYISAVIGALPFPGEKGSEVWVEHAAYVMTRASFHFNRAQRAYYFGLAVLSWFVHPLALIAASVCVTFVLYRREFRSNMTQRVRWMLEATEP